MVYTNLNVNYSIKINRKESKRTYQGKGRSLIVAIIMPKNPHNTVANTNAYNTGIACLIGLAVIILQKRY